jgi:hypothetical protein
MRQPSYMRSVVDRNVVMRHIPVFLRFGHLCDYLLTWDCIDTSNDRMAIESKFETMYNERVVAILIHCRNYGKQQKP